MERNLASTPQHQLEAELAFAQPHTAEFVHGLERGRREAHITEFEAQGAPHIHFPDIQRRMIKCAHAEGRGRYDREGSRAHYYGVRAGIDSVIEGFSNGSS